MIYLVAAKVSLNAILLMKVTKHKKTENIVEPINEFEDKSHLLRARSLKNLVDDIIWVRILNPTLEHQYCTVSGKLVSVKRLVLKNQTLKF